MTMRFEYLSKFVGRGCKRYLIVCHVGDKAITLDSTGDKAITGSMVDNTAGLNIVAEVAPQHVIETLRNMGYKNEVINEIEEAIV